MNLKLERCKRRGTCFWPLSSTSAIWPKSRRRARAGTGSQHGSLTLALADVDGNGTLDLYIGNNRTDDIRDRGKVDIFMRNGQYVIPPALQDRLVVVNGRVLEYGDRARGPLPARGGRLRSHLP